MSGRSQQQRGGGRPAEPAPTNAVVVFDPVQAGAKLTQAVRDRRPQLAALLSLNIDAADPRERERARSMLDRFETVALHAATSQRELLECTTESLVEAIRQSAILGLEPTGALGDGAIVRYNNRVRVERPSARPNAPANAMVVVEETVPTAQFQPMYRGLLKLARRSDQIRVIDAAVVYAGDAYDVELGTEPRVRHVPWPQSGKAERGEPVSVYAFARLTNGELVVETATVADVEAIRRTSRAKDSGPWVTFWSEMARAKILRRLMKRLPLESAAEHAIRLETEAESAPVAPDVVSRESVASAPATRLLDRLGVPADVGAVTTDPPVSVDPGASEVSGDQADEPSSSSDSTEGREEGPEGDEATRRRAKGADDPADVSDGSFREPDGDQDDPPCEKPSPYSEGQVCRLPKGHGGPHQAGERETWL